jgi:hypothetical protein
MNFGERIRNFINPPIRGYGVFSPKDGVAIGNLTREEAIKLANEKLPVPEQSKGKPEISIGEMILR